MSKDKGNILFGRLGNKTTDIKYFKHLLPMDIKRVVEPFGGTFAVSRIIYKDDKYEKHVNDNDDELKIIYNDPEGYDKTSRLLNEIAKSCIKKTSKNPIYKEFIEKIKDIDVNKQHLEQWKKEKIMRGSLIKTVKNYDCSNFINVMKKINFTYDDYLKILNKFKTDNEAFIFLDPPYLFSDNSAYSQQKRKEGIDCTDILCEIIQIFRDETTKAKIMLIINDMKIIRWLFNGYIKGEYQKIYQVAKRKTGHLIITNY